MSVYINHSTNDISTNASGSPTIGGKAILPYEIQPIDASVSGNALTITLNPTVLDFRSSTIGSGTVNRRSVPAAISVTVSSGSTLGTVNAVQSRLAVLAIDNAGTVEIAVVNMAGGKNLDETTLISTTAEGGAGGADSESTIYSTTARTNVPFRVVGFVESTQATAGTWATAPSTIQGVGGASVLALFEAANSAVEIATVVPSSDADVVLTGAQVSKGIIRINTGAWTAGHNIIVPNEVRQWVVQNATPYDLVVKTVAGLGITVTASRQMAAFCDATDVLRSDNRSATTVHQGITRFATDAEAQAWSADVVIQGSSLYQALKGANQSTASNGYQKLPGGLIIQWGAYGSGVHAPTINFPISFPNATLHVGATIVSGATASVEGVNVTNITTTSFQGRQLGIAGATSTAFYWIALGF